MLVMALYTQMIDAQIWYYDEMRKTDKAESGQTEIGGEIVNIAFEGNLEKFGGYGDSTVVNKKIGNEEGAIEYAAEMLGDGDQNITAFYVFCVFRRSDPATSNDLHIKDLFAFYYKTEPDAEWIEFPITDDMEEVVFPGGWSRSAVVGASMDGIEATNFKVVIKDKTFEGDGDNWSAYVGKIGLYTGEPLDIDLAKQYSISTIENKYWLIDGDADLGRFVHHTDVAKPGTASAWTFHKHANNTYTIRTGENAELAFNMNYAKWDNDLWMGFVKEFQGSGAAPYEKFTVKSTYLIGKNMDGTYQFRRAQDGRLIGKAENKNDECVSVCRPEDNYARDITLEVIGDVVSVDEVYDENLLFTITDRNLVINGLEKNNKINISSLSGTMIISDIVNSSAVSYSMEQGIYVVNIITNKGIVTKKIFVK